MFFYIILYYIPIRYYNGYNNVHIMLPIISEILKRLQLIYFIVIIIIYNNTHHIIIIKCIYYSILLSNYNKNHEIICIAEKPCPYAMCVVEIRPISTIK